MEELTVRDFTVEKVYPFEVVKLLSNGNQMAYQRPMCSGDKFEIESGILNNMLVDVAMQIIRDAEENEDTIFTILKSRK